MCPRMRLFRACDCFIGEQQQSVLQAAFGKHSKDRSVVLQFGMKKHVAFVDKPLSYVVSDPPFKLVDASLLRKQLWVYSRCSF